MNDRDFDSDKLAKDRLITTEEVADLLGLAPGTLRKLRSEGRSPVPFYKPFNDKTLRAR